MLFNSVFCGILIYSLSLSHRLNITLAIACGASLAFAVADWRWEARNIMDELELEDT